MENLRKRSVTAVAPVALSRSQSLGNRGRPPAQDAAGALSQSIFVVPLSKDLKLMKVGHKDCFVFGFGCLVCWACRPEEAAAAKEALRPFLIDALLPQNVDEEQIDIVIGVGRDSNDLGLSCRDPPTFERVAMAYALAQSVRLGSLELRVNGWIAKTRSIPEEMARVGHVSLSSGQVYRMIGELFVLKHEANLETDILDTPEFFWDYGDYEPLYQSCREHLDIDQRVSVLNQRFEVLEDMFDVLENEAHERHSVRLEWIIIILCACEALVMAIRFYIRVFLEDSGGQDKPHPVTPVLWMLSVSCTLLWQLLSVLAGCVHAVGAALTGVG